MESPSPQALPGPSQPRRVSKSQLKAHALELLHGSLLRYEEPFDPVAEGEWEVLA